jgi:hypothetical protein
VATGTVKHLRELAAGYRAIGKALPGVRRGLRAAGESAHALGIVARSAIDGIAAAAEATNRASLELWASIQAPSAGREG